MSALRFAAIGLNHDHVYGQVNVMLRAGAELVSFQAIEDDLARTFKERFPQAERADDRRRILEDPSIQLVVSAAISDERAGVAIDAMRHGKDVMLDKPGMVTLEQLAEVRKVQAETRRIVSILYSEHFETASTVKAGELVKAGAIGKVIHTTGLGPHRLRKPTRPDWFFDRPRYGGIIADIAAHQCEQFLFFTNSLEAEVLSATVANRANPDTPGLQDYGDIHLRTPTATGYIRVDWFTPDGLPTWGDGRLFIVGTEGTIELRKYIDIAGRQDKDHLFIVDRSGVRHIDCCHVELPYGRQLAADIRDRTETAMGQEHCFKAMELALKAQALAEISSSSQTQK
ncbi:Gfo/Idh/MocA family oxidoreductase [Mesorhizobium sp. M00.F.Ca.ET.216.01.1.1]|uniref:Gfo/Idh/MocA family protein n=1 Tax=Mesorhizobium sp. M00.F.Ca.ET.216.01.1.1 TaxID=2500528 RepID=UPI000FDB20EB|nr:Gfo/Idh/MocA family oxidoreductase [Mesorhizobium sp. M00.F.Ca.ET.216.01.1.1]TGQ45797.1 Gfo/Idh/MocA family oxidoreductase [Mesorhizobium sp. M00.F.Ca.ET.216.01.1.1]TJW12954.1 MAG: Gfo/Idh/MocA family oxidoreductase [Mesorhizobium sp.]TJW48066.1 MAG: Gfo/Idh/MocA family oxidoreductase [Mesorhizobium sp.]